MSVSARLAGYYSRTLVQMTIAHRGRATAAIARISSTSPLSARAPGLRGSFLSRAVYAHIPRACLAFFCVVGPACRTQSPPAPRVLRVASPSAPVTLDPHLHNENFTFSLLANIHDGLTAFDAQMGLRPALAVAWESPSDTVWRFTLRRSARFHDGRPLTAADVVSSLERARHHPRSVVASYLVAVESVAALDEGTVEIRTLRPYPLLANKLTFVSIVPQDAPEEITHPVGTGPFRYVSYDEEVGLKLRGVPDAWSGQHPWDEVRFLFEPSSLRRAELWLDGEVEIAQFLTPEAAALVTDRMPEALVLQEGTNVSYLGVRMDRAPFSDPRVRRALSLALDRGVVAEQLGNEVVPTGQLVSPHVFGHVPSLEPPEQDLAVARSLLAEAGLAEGSILTLETSPTHAREARATASQLSQVGLDIRVVERPGREFYARVVAGDVSLFLISYICSAGDASDLFDAALHTRDPMQGWGQANLMRYSNAALDRLIERAGSERLMSERRLLLAEATKLALGDLPLIPLWYKRHFHAVQPWLSWQPRNDARLLAVEVEPDTSAPRASGS